MTADFRLSVEVKQRNHLYLQALSPALSRKSKLADCRHGRHPEKAAIAPRFVGQVPSAANPLRANPLSQILDFKGWNS